MFSDFTFRRFLWYVMMMNMAGEIAVRLLFHRSTMTVFWWIFIPNVVLILIDFAVVYYYVHRMADEKVLMATIGAYMEGESASSLRKMVHEFADLPAQIRAVQQVGNASRTRLEGSLRRALPYVPLAVGKEVERLMADGEDGIDRAADLLWKHLQPGKAEESRRRRNEERRERQAQRLRAAEAKREARLARAADREARWEERAQKRFKEGLTQQAQILWARARALGMSQDEFVAILKEPAGIDGATALITRRERLQSLRARAKEFNCLHLVEGHLVNEDADGAAMVLAKVEQLLRDAKALNLTRQVPQLIARGDLAGAEAAVRDARTQAERDRRFQPYADRIRALHPGKAQDELWRQMKALKRLTLGTREYRKAEHAFEQALANAERYGTLQEPPN